MVYGHRRDDQHFFKGVNILLNALSDVVKEITSAKFQQENQRIAQNQDATIAKLQTDLQKVQMQLEQKDMANKRTSAVQLETSGV